MIKKFNTTAAAPAAATGGAPTTGGSSSGSGMNKILVGLLVVGAIYIGYQFVYKPMMEKRKQQANDAED